MRKSNEILLISGYFLPFAFFGEVFLLNHTCIQSYCQPFPYKFIIANFQWCIYQHSNCFSWRNYWKHCQTRMFPPRLLALGKGREKEDFFLFFYIITENKLLPKLVLIRLSEKKKSTLGKITRFYFVYYKFIFLGACAVWVTCKIKREFFIVKMWSKCAVSATKRLLTSEVAVCDVWKL